LIAKINSGSKDPIHGSPTERKERLPNVYERQGDAYMFGPEPNHLEAASSYYKAISASSGQGYDNSATFWFHLTRMYYKHALALSLSSDFENVESTIDASLKAAEDLEGKFQGQMADDADTFQNQQAAYAKEQKIAQAVFSLKQAEAEGRTIESELEELQHFITDTNPSKVTRSNVEVLLLVFQVLFSHKEELQASANLLPSKLLGFTSGMREGDPAIRTKYLAPVFRSAAEAVPDQKRQLEAVLDPAI
jgi:hypothetical protein